jgi:hypothetical protein
LAAAAAEALPPIVFVSRSIGSPPAQDGRPAAIHVAGSGRLLVLAPDGTRRPLVDASTMPGAPVDVMDPEVSYDGTRVLFSGYVAGETGWRIFEISASGSDLRQITRSDRSIDLDRFGEARKLLETYDDVDPCYLGDGRICFVSTRYPQIAPDGRLRATNLYLVNQDGSDLHRITTERFGADTPTIDPTTGKIVYSRWWRSGQAVSKPDTGEPEPVPPGSPGYGDVGVDESAAVVRAIPEEQFPGVNSWFLSSLRPDGTELVMFSGFRLDRGLTQAHRPSFLADGSALALFIPQTPFLGYPRGNGLRSFVRGPFAPTGLGGPQAFALTPADAAAGDPGRVPPGQPPLPPPVLTEFLYASAAPLPDGRYLITGAPTIDPARADYGVYTQEGTAQPVLLHDAAGTAELDAVPLVARPAPPSVDDRVTGRLPDDVPRDEGEAYAQGSFKFVCENIHFNAAVDFAIPHAPPIGRRLAIEFYTNPQRTSPTGGDAPILLHRLDIPNTGRIEIDLPAGVPLFEVLRQSDGQIPVGRDGQIFHVGGFNFGRAGETNRCVGCHAGHSQLAVPEEVAWTNVAPSAEIRASSEQVVANRELKRQLGASNLIDRRTDDLRIWSAQAQASHEVTLRWSTSLRAREVIVHAPPLEDPQQPELRQQIRSVTIATWNGAIPVQEPPRSAEVSSEGTRVALDPEVDFDRLVLTIEQSDVVGTYLGSRGPALAEIEVIGQATGEPRPMFVRGDTDCNQAIQITDAITTLIHLFLGGRKICCEAAADANDDGAVNITDPIFSLGFMFQGMAVIPAPFPGCGPGTNASLSCEASRCN